MADLYDNFLPPLETEPDPVDSRRSFFRRAGQASAAAAAVVAGVPLLDARSASAQTMRTDQLPLPGGDGAGLLPEIGQTINCSCNAFGATLIVNLPPPAPRLNFIGSIVVKVTVGGANFVRLQVLNHTVEGFHDMFGKVTIRLPDVDVSPESLLSVTGPGSLLAKMMLNFDITFERCGNCEGPFLFRTLEPAQLVGNVTTFPPPPQGTNPDGSPSGGQLYRMAAPIKIGMPGDSRTYMRLDGMNINVGQLV
ncbi:hypothetical protein [Prauserella muralis]|uniref:Uncharacterized protein n=1 Tax=Prauserella muralis TaxID=588067 RepID=A0A2V4BD32_9PSEU|nr:hypothetical protein [Prauserella muralis]PXY31969.1 hypothetical protein BAY60_06495 [Prauserella muralis]TWE13603.1 hypothetical protein FHX69_5727 [Prauserella muralis]